MSTLTRTRGDVIFDSINTAVMIMVMAAVLYPLYFIIIASFSNPTL